MSRVNKDAHEKYLGLNRAYGEAMDGILPKLTANMIAQADKGNYQSIANAFTRTNADQINAFMNSIDTAYNQAKIAGMDIGETTGLRQAYAP